MKIIKEGNPDWNKKLKEFTCHHCGCVFVADHNEYIVDAWRNTETYTCNCPCCDNKVYLEEQNDSKTSC